MIERSYNDPSISNVDQCVYDICMTVDKNCSMDHVTSIQRHKYAVYRFHGLIQDIFGAFLGIFHIWLPNSRYEMNERYCLGIYRTLNMENMQMVEMDLCIPIK